MPSSCKYLPLLAVIVLFACKAPSKVYDLHQMKDFNIEAGNEFVNKIERVKGINMISILDTRYDGNDFRVNNQEIFLDTTQQDLPNYYSYKKRAAELHIPADSLFSCLKLFDKMKVNEFERDENHYRFRVIVGFTTNRGYIYSYNGNSKTGDTLMATSGEHPFKVILTKRLDTHWFEYYEKPM